MKMKDFESRIVGIFAIGLLGLLVFTLQNTDRNVLILEKGIRLEEKNISPHSYPHDTNAFTEGLIYQDGVIYESIGLYGMSELRKTDLKTGSVLLSKKLPDEFFGEGIALVDDKIIQLTWKAGKAFVYDKDSLELLNTFSYAEEGWGLTYDGKNLIMSDGSSRLRFFNPVTFQETKSLEVRENGNLIRNVNELEYINGKIYANIWMEDFILVISPVTGSVEKKMDISELSETNTLNPDNVLNGIAWDSENNRMLFTGKRWNKIYDMPLE